MGIKNAEFDVYFESDEKVDKKLDMKKVNKKRDGNMRFFTSTHVRQFFCFFLVNFYETSTDLKSALNSAFFIHILNIF
jgi:hypothetical protein